MAAIITAIGDLVTGSITWLTSFVTAITKAGNELLLIFVITAFVGLGVGLINRIIRL